MNQSEVARLREQIDTQMEAMRRGMQGLASGSARHAFIQARMERIDEYQRSLAGYVSEQDADQLLYNLYVEAIG